MRAEFRNNSDAVSPVIGVMLMITVTLILAGLVSSFAGGMGSDNTYKLHATIKASSFEVNETDNAYVVFDHLAGDPLNLNDFEIHLGSRDSPHNRTVISNGLRPTTTSSFDSDGAHHYLEGYPDGKLRIWTGDRFVLHADYTEDGRVCWKHENAEKAFSLESGDILTYEIIDRKTGMPVTSGQIPVPAIH